MDQSTSDVTRTRHRLDKLLQLYGYSACLEALVLLVDHYASSALYGSLDDYVAKLNRTITFDIDGSSSVIDPDLAHTVVKKLVDESRPPVEVGMDSDDDDDAELPVELPIRVQNVEYQAASSPLKPQDPKAAALKRGNEFNIHYNFLFKRLEALPVFKDNFALTKLSTLNGSSAPSIRCVCFGLLVKDISKIESYLLIDSTGRVPLRITPDTTFRNKLAYTNCIVLVEGVYVNPDDVLFAANIGLPPVLLDPLKDKHLACRHEKMVVILRELFMDDDDVVRHVDMLFTGYNSMEEPPAVFILIGDFTRHPYRHAEDYRRHAKKLVRIIRTCDNLKGCHFVLVPGPRDTCFVGPDGELRENSAMPKQPLTKEHMPVGLLHLSQFQHVHLATNPTHIHLGQERKITVVCQAYLKELPKNLLHDLHDHNEEFFENAKHIMLSNGHLSSGASKFYLSSMNLWHRPDLLVLADTEAFGTRYDYSSSKQHDTTFTTVPSFSRQFSQFKVYYLKSGEVEDSQVSPDALQQIEIEDSDDGLDQDDAVQIVEQKDRQQPRPPEEEEEEEASPVSHSEAT